MAKPTFRRAAENFGWLLAERGVRFGLGTVIGFVVARKLGPVQLGSLSYCLAVVTLFQCFAGFGVDAVVRRDLLQSPGDSARLLADSLGVRLLAGLVAALGLAVFMVVSPLHAPGEGMIFLILSLLLWQPAWTVPELWLQAHLRARYAVTAQTAALAVSAAVRVWLVWQDAPLAGYAAANLLESVLTGVGLHIAGHRAGLRVAWRDMRATSMRRLAGASAPLLVASLAIIVYMKIDEIMLRQMAGTAAVGIYAAATRLTEIWYFLPVALGSSLLPALIRARNGSAELYRRHLQQYYDASAGVAYGLAVPVALFAPWLIRLAYGEAFAAASPVLSVHIWTSIFVFIGVARGQWLVNEGLTTFYLFATLAGAGINIILNYIFIPRWGPVGAAWATLVAYALAVWVTSFAYARTRATAWMQTRALLLPVLGWRYFFK